MCVVSAKGAAFLLSPPKDGFAVANLGQRPRNSPAPTSPSAEGAIHVVATGSPQDESVRCADLWPVPLSAAFTTARRAVATAAGMSDGAWSVVSLVTPQATTKGGANYPVVEAFVSNAWFGAWHKHRYNAADTAASTATQSLPQAADRLSYRRSDRWQRGANNVFRLLQ